MVSALLNMASCELVINSGDCADGGALHGCKQRPIPHASHCYCRARCACCQSIHELGSQSCELSLKGLFRSK